MSNVQAWLLRLMDNALPGVLLSVWLLFCAAVGAAVLCLFWRFWKNSNSPAKKLTAGFVSALVPIVLLAAGAGWFAAR